MYGVQYIIQIEAVYQNYEELQLIDEINLKIINKQQIHIYMNKCTHNQQIKMFCMKAGCEYAAAGGCIKCFNAEHLHDKQQLIDIQQVTKLMARYSFPNKVKPQCVSLQESFYSYFKKTQNQIKQIIAILDQICKNVVNTIGFPYISFKNHFTVYKRIKNKQYSRVSTPQFQKFINETKSISLSKLAQLEQKLYLKQVNSCHEMIKQIDHMLAAFQNVTKYYDQKVKFIHDSSAYTINKEIVEKIKAHFKANTTKIQNTQAQNMLNPQKIKRSATEQQSLYKSVNSGGSKNPDVSELKKTMQPRLSAITKPKEEKSHNQPQSYRRNDSLYIQTKGIRDRQSSIDHRLVGNKERLESKITKLKKSQRVETQLVQTQSGQMSKQKLKNINLPAGEQKNKKQKATEQVQIIPITRKLKQKLYEEKQMEQISSPILKKKLKSQNRKISIQKQKNSESPSIMLSPDSNQIKGSRSNTFELRMQKVKQSLPELFQSQQKSFVILIASLKLQASLAIPMVQKALQQCNKNLSAAQYLSFLYLQSNQFQKCLNICDTYLEMISNTKGLTDSKTLLLNNKASALNNLGRYSQTIKLLQNCEHSNDLICKNLANAFFGLGYLDRAVALYRKLLATCYDDEAYYNLSGCLYLNYEYTEAKIAIESALINQPQNKDYLQLQMHIVNAAVKQPNGHKA